MNRVAPHHRPFPVAAYLARIGLPALPPATADGLSELVLAQVRAIAFENLDVLAGLPVRLDRAVVYEKILGDGRGGYCFELNALMSGALEAAGFEVRPVMARVTYGRTVPGPATHQALPFPGGNTPHTKHGRPRERCPGRTRAKNPRERTGYAPGENRSSAAAPCRKNARQD